jgi:hypothetical protein
MNIPDKMKFGPVSVLVVPVEYKVRLVNGKHLAVATFVLTGLGPERNRELIIDQLVPSVHAPMFREDMSHTSTICICKQEEKGIQNFLLFHELLHAAAWILHFPPRVHFWIDRFVRSQVLDTPCPPK